ncbi:hypothetical protein ACWEKT_40380 [Nocardia takedensis]|uniref:hypothetical protein n=1 Tax=Nocardia takedensis TaxID=259390 RepID=UPI003F760821
MTDAGEGGWSTERPLRHIRIRVDTLTVDYLAPREQAADVARELMASYSGLDIYVSIDDDLDQAMTLMPCSRLWGTTSRPA